MTARPTGLNSLAKLLKIMVNKKPRFKMTKPLFQDCPFFGDSDLD